MKNTFFSTSVLAILIFAMAIVSCKKQTVADPTPEKLRNTTWLLTKEILYFPNGNLEIFTRNNVWTFSDNYKLNILNPDMFINTEKGDWNRSTDNKIKININNNDVWHYTRSYKIIDELDSFMRLEVEDLVIESSNNGKTSKIVYELIKL